ncbi:yars1 [Symbiodinium pilosum]|uniref:Yars1 protein n=1 Tax=Symbiodinium pilosum TaxID=2952 RepID=A0A812X6G8_SYMPI|nr:yars1 [Symbiodinium pilosum]
MVTRGQMPLGRIIHSPCLGQTVPYLPQATARYVPAMHGPAMPLPFSREAEVSRVARAAGAAAAAAFVVGSRAVQRRNLQVIARKGQSDVSMIDFRVGEIKSCEKHPDSDKLLVEQIDVGEEAPRQICSGIGKFFEPDQIIGKRVVIVSNLKARKMAGTASEGMLLCASKRADPEDAESELAELKLVEAPADAQIGERIVVDMPDEEHGQAATPNKVGKKKLYEKVAPDLRTNQDGMVERFHFCKQI